MTRTRRHDDLPQAEAYWSRVRWIQRASPYVDEAGFAALEGQLRRRGNGTYSPRDVWWIAANQAGIAAMASGAWHKAGAAYWSMGQLLCEEHGPPMPEQAVSLMRTAVNAFLRSWSDAGPLRVEVASCPCAACSRSVEPRDLVREMVQPRIPHPRCNGPIGCTCVYIAVLDV